MAEKANGRGAAARVAAAWRVLTRNDDAKAAPPDWWARILETASRANSGVRVTTDTALQATVVLACARVISEGVAQTPWSLKRRQADRRTWLPDETHPVAQLLRKPNEFQTGFEFKETLTMHAVLGAGGRAVKLRNSQGRVVELIPLVPKNVIKKQRDDYSVFYEVHTARGGQPIIMEGRDVLDIAGTSWDGVNGLEAVKLAREAIGLSLATEESHARLHANGVRFAGVLTTPAALGNEAATRIKDDWAEAFGGTKNWYKTPVLEGGMDFKQLGMSAVDAQHLETRRFQIEEICRAMRVFPQMVMHSDKTATFASAEQFFLAHVTHTLGPWVQRWAERLDLHLLAPSTERDLWVHFDLNGLAPGDARTRADYVTKLAAGGIITPNEARSLLPEGLNPLAGGDDLRAPLNQAPVDQETADNAAPPKDQE